MLLHAFFSLKKVACCCHEQIEGQQKGWLFQEGWWKKQSVVTKGLHVFNQQCSLSHHFFPSFEGNEVIKNWKGGKLDERDTIYLVICSVGFIHSSTYCDQFVLSFLPGLLGSFCIWLYYICLITPCLFLS